MAAPIGPKKVRRYTIEFKVQAVRLSLQPDFQTQDVAKGDTPAASGNGEARVEAPTQATAG